MRLMLALVYSFVISHVSFGQELLPDLLDTVNQSQRFSFQSNAFYSSSSLRNDLTKKLLFGGEISEENKLSSLDEHKGINTFGGGLRFRFQYFSDVSISKKNKELSWLIDGGVETHVAAQYAGDLFGLAFFGNDLYKGKLANFSNSLSRLQTNYSIGFGIHNKKTKSYISLNALFPRNDFNIDIDRGGIRTSENGDTVSITLDTRLSQSFSPAFFQGIGAAINLNWNIPINAPSSSITGFMTVKVRNLGFIYLNSVEQISVNANIDFEGYSLSDLSTIVENPDSFLNDSINVSRDTSGTWRTTPGFIQVGKTVERHNSNQVQSFFGIRMYVNNIYRPLGFLGLNWSPLEQVAVGAQLAYGGYANFRAGIYVGYMNENLSLSLGSEDVLGLMIDSQFGQSLLMKLSWNI